MATNNTPNEPVKPQQQTETPVTEKKHIDFVRDTHPPPPPQNDAAQTGTTKEKL